MQQIYKTAHRNRQQKMLPSFVFFIWYASKRTCSSRYFSVKFDFKDSNFGWYKRLPSARLRLLARVMSLLC